MEKEPEIIEFYISGYGIKSQKIAEMNYDDVSEEGLRRLSLRDEWRTKKRRGFILICFIITILLALTLIVVI